MLVFMDFGGKLTYTTGVLILYHIETAGAEQMSFCSSGITMFKQYINYFNKLYINGLQ